ncbi:MULTISPECIES: hypothetical protein [unclassified Streptomyces]|uniref:hypothetical protein n=1 Tax=unclassified Streptomyces TaxID=2593676 RepID=UPI0035D743BD
MGIGIVVGLRVCDRHTTVADDFVSLSDRSAWTVTFSGSGRWAVLDGCEDGRQVFSRTWNETVPQNLA